METLPPLTGAQKTRLRGLGQTLGDMLKIGQAGATPSVVAELNRLLAAHELVKVRFLGADRDQRAALSAELATQAPCAHVGSVGATALFYRAQPDPEKRRIAL
ncbi:MAG: YhbY family RNA-binding protein [Opitutae bacterium]|nr:YhbY family RNA-binding protein [Opitutae bacterium]